MSRYASPEEKALIESMPQEEVNAILGRVKAMQKEYLNREISKLRASRRSKPDPQDPLSQGASQK